MVNFANKNKGNTFRKWENTDLSRDQMCDPPLGPHSPHLMQWSGLLLTSLYWCW